MGDAVHPRERASALGVYRFWRDAGAMAGALLVGAATNLLGFVASIQLVAVLSGLAALRLLPASSCAGQVVLPPPARDATPGEVTQ